MAITFADISHWQTQVDLASYTAAGYDRIAMKATEGTTIVDPAFAARWAHAGRLGLARIAYHFARTTNSGAAEFGHFLATVTAAGAPGGGDLLCLDIEDSSNSPRADEYAAEFTRRAVERGHPIGCVYTGRWYAEPANLRPDDLTPGWRQLWLSDYTTASDANLTLPAGWSRGQLIARQYTNAARIPGIAGPSDANRVINDWLTRRDEMLSDDDKDWIRQTLLTQARVVLSTRQDPGAATPREMMADWPRVRTAIHTGVDVEELATAIVAKLPGGVTVDVPALASAVADELYQRLAK